MAANLGKIRDLKLDTGDGSIQVDHRQNSACCRLLLIKFYWDTAMPLVYILSAAIFTLQGET